MSDNPTLFISYSHRDEDEKDFVVSHLKVLERQGVFDVWDDRRIKGGGNWQAEIDAALDRADIAVLLISRHFLTSDFIMDHEVQTILRRHADRDVIPYPLLISDCAWSSIAWLRSLNLRPKDGKPLNSFPEAERDQVTTDVAEEIATMLHPEKDGPTIRPNHAPRHQQSSTDGGFLVWWRNAGVTARATVIAGLALLWGIVASITDSGNNITVENGNYVGGDVTDSEIRIEKK